MASVTSLDKDMRKLRLDRYTPQAANEVRTFIEGSLGERLAPGDLMDALKDGIALCKLVNLAVPNPIRFKQKAVMPFVQMENISIFLEACKRPPLNLQNHDVFLTVDLYESKDPAQVLQCLGAFSRIAHQLQPSHFPAPIGGKSRSGMMSPQDTGNQYGSRGRGASNASNTSSNHNTSYRPSSALNSAKTEESSNGRWSPTKSSGPISPGGGVSSWSKKSDEGATSPAWNIAQYGYMGGASQGNLGVSFGGRRQITSAGPHVPNLAEKEKRRREKEAEEEKARIQRAEEEQRLREEQEAEEERARVAEEQRWFEETRKLKQQEERRAEEEKRKWEEEERQWQMEEVRRQKEEQEAEAKLAAERQRIGRGRSGSQLQGQYLSQYQAENGVSSESSRIKELERELEQARERERQYERERQAKLSSNGRQATEDHDRSIRMKEESSKARARSRSRPRLPSRKNSDEEWRKDEREYLRAQHKAHTNELPSKSPRPLPEPTPPVRVKTNHTGPSARPLPDPSAYASPPANNPSTGQNRTDRYLSSNPAPQPVQPKTTYASELGGFDSVAERDAEDRRRVASQKQTKAGGWASKSLLEREMEMERQRQQEWEESQKETKSKAKSGEGVDGIGGGIGGKWDVNQWTGYTGGDGQNRGTQGIGSGRRQIVGPRPPPSGGR
ncbi:calponin [Phlyctema vagabunda]|uniref:Calponin n=1 Tax=Phlyctema vagabunda TaxID=108571 RepID=A0ABR4PXW9_9HELO